MYIDRDQAIRQHIAPLAFEVERGRLRLFAKAIGLTDPVYVDVAAARSAGHPDLLVPPTFLGNSLELEIAAPLSWLSDLGGDLTKTTHAEQAFIYHAMAYAGDSLVLHRRIVDVYTKKGGALEFVVKQTDVKRGDKLLAEVHCVIALRHPEVAA